MEQHHVGASVEGSWQVPDARPAEFLIQPQCVPLPTPVEGAMVELLGASVLARWEFPDAVAYRVGWGGHLVLFGADQRVLATFTQHTVVQSMADSRTGQVRTGDRPLGRPA